MKYGTGIFITGYPRKAGHRTLNSTEGTYSKILRILLIISILGIQIQLGNFYFRQKSPFTINILTNTVYGLIPQ